MKEQELYLKDGRPTGVWVCGECQTLHTEIGLAQQCCEPRHCGACGAGLEKNRYYLCKSCAEKVGAEKEKMRFEAAQKLTPEEYSGWVYVEGFGAGDGYFPSIGELLVYIRDAEAEEVEALEKAPYCFACTSVQFAQINIGGILEGIYESDQAYEDFDPNIVKVPKELERGIEAFNEANENIVSYFPDYKRAIILNPKDWARDAEGGTE